MITRERALVVVSLSIFITSLYCVASGKSVYVISNTDNSIIQAYDIQDSSLSYQTMYDSDKAGAVGIAIDACSETFFVTFENQSDIELVNAKTMQPVDTVTTLGASNLAGIVADQSKQKIYVMDRSTNHLYVYSWDAVNKRMSLGFPDPYYIELENCYEALGVAIDEESGRLFVGDNTTNVKYYDTNDWTYLGSVDVDHVAVGVTVDTNSGYLYTGGHYNHTYLVRYNLNEPSGSADEINIGTGITGLSVDPNTSLLYITTTGGNIRVYNTSNWGSDPCYVGGNNLGAPADICLSGDVSYKPLLLTIVKDINDINSASPVVLGGDDYLQYEIYYDANGNSDQNVIITDYLPSETDFNCASGNGEYNYDSHTVTWDIGDISPTDSNSVDLTVNVYSFGEIITNYCEIESDEYCSYDTKSKIVFSVVGNGSFENDGEIPDISEKAPEYWSDVNIPTDNFGGKIKEVDDDWSTKGDHSLTIYSKAYKLVQVGDIATVSQQVYLEDVNTVSFDVRLFSSSGYPWNPDRFNAVLLIDGNELWNSDSNGTGVYLGQQVAVDEYYKDEFLHTLSLGLKVKQDGYDIAHELQWDFVRFDTHCQGLGYAPEDLNYDCCVDFIDLKMLANHWLEEEPPYKYDLFKDGQNIVNFHDFSNIANKWKSKAGDQDGKYFEESRQGGMMLKEDVQDDVVQEQEDYSEAEVATGHQEIQVQPKDIEALIEFLEMIWEDEEVRQVLGKERWEMMMESLRREL